MSTRSFISLKAEDGVKGIYCHSDGYPTHNGALLLDHYNSIERVEELLALGDLSYLSKNISPDKGSGHRFGNPQEGVTVAYHRDRGEELNPARVVELNSLKDGWLEYAYVYEDGVGWKVGELDIEDDEDVTLKDVQEVLDAEYKALGIERPAGFYGYISTYTARRIKEAEQSADLRDREVFNVGKATSYRAILMDLGIQDIFNEPVAEYVERFKKSWGKSIEEIAQLYICLNHKIFEKSKADEDRSFEYQDEWAKLNDWVDENFKGKDLETFYTLVD